jgi:sulfoxide reductase heme-binding subunit YedZ
VNRILGSKWTKAAVFLVCVLPLARLGTRAWRQDLGANPVEFITHATGDWALRFLLITLAVTPIRKLLNMPQFTQFRRMLGLFAFFYGCLHFLTYLWLDQAFDLTGIFGDIAKRPFITIGFPVRRARVQIAVSQGGRVSNGVSFGEGGATSSGSPWTIRHLGQQSASAFVVRSGGRLRI